jgi:alcohol dehydrogenase (cytochrome c)
MGHHITGIGSAFCAALLGGTAAVAATPQTPAFTALQAEVGQHLYAAHCASCHGAELVGGAAPALAGPAFRAHWAWPAQSLDDLLTYTSKNMPLNAAGSLPHDDYVAILAFLLSRNGHTAGDHRLAGGDATLKTVAFAAAARTATPQAADFTAGPHGTTPSETGPSQAELTGAATQGADWLTTNRDYSGTRLSPLAQIDRSNVGKLQPVCSASAGPATAFQTSPVVYQGVMYFTSGFTTFAIDAATCTLRWQHTWPSAMAASTSIITNRGVALKDGRVLRGTGDGFLLALDAKTGALLWARHIADPAKGEFFTMPPLVYDDMVFIGPAVSEYGVRGWIGAFRIADGTRVWRFNIVPKPGEAGSQTWPSDPKIPVGGGAVWTALSLDPDKQLLFIATANPAPDLAVAARGGGIDLYTNSLLALHLRTGALAWYDQIVPLDDHDWDLTHAGPLYQATVDGKTRDLIATAGKDGILRVLDRDTRKLVLATPLTTVSNATAAIAGGGADVCPGVLGGVQWNGPAYLPGANLLVTPSVDWCSHYTLDSKVEFVPGQFYLGGAATMKPDASGWLTAVDATTGAVKWRLHSPRPVLAGVTPTASSVIFAGELTGDLIAVDATNGAVLFRHKLGGPLGAGVVTYQVAGKQYVAAASGTPSGFWASPSQPQGGPAITVFALPDPH